MAKKAYKDLAPGGYAARMGGVEKIVTVPANGVYVTDDPAEQDYFEGVLGRVGEEAPAEAPKPAKDKEDDE